MNCYIEYLHHLSEQLRQDEQPPLASASPGQIESFRQNLMRELGIEPPAAYVEFLRLANGFNYNGVFFFCIDDSVALPSLIEENKTLRTQHPTLEEYLILGQSGLWYYAYHLASSTYRAVQVETVEETYYIFEDFDDCLSSALEETLELLEETVDNGE